MSQSTDAALIAALDSQARRLTELIVRLEVARVTLVPSSVNFWLGAARLAYDSALENLAVMVDASIAAVRTAYELTVVALYEVQARG